MSGDRTPVDVAINFRNVTTWSEERLNVNKYNPATNLLVFVLQETIVPLVYGNPGGTLVSIHCDKFLQLLCPQTHQISLFPVRFSLTLRYTVCRSVPFPEEAHHWPVTTHYPPLLSLIKSTVPSSDDQPYRCCCCCCVWIPSGSTGVIPENTARGVCECMLVLKRETVMCVFVLHSLTSTSLFTFHI